MSSSTLSAPDLSSGVFTDTTPREIAVSVRGLSKSYSIAKNAAQHTSAGEAIMHKLRHPFEKVERDTFWALNDVSFDIQKGDVVGIIGRNGAGKSTLLKILSRITEPTKGRIDLYGRVGSLLEVGTGFHAELTGRENIFLNGAILGMQKSEIARQFDAIVDFAGVEQFLDTPVKRYSSGMYVRLAFAVAAHLNPEILIVDEVLAVGDAEFQKKCLGKMQDVANSGRTVLFVSHNMDAIRNLCSHGLLLHQGRLIFNGNTDICIARYMDKGGRYNNSEWQRSTEDETPPLYIQKVSARMLGRQPNITLDVRLTLASVSPHQPAFVAVDIANASGTVVMQALPTVDKFISYNLGQHDVHLAVDLPPLIPGQYWLTIWTGSHNTVTLDLIQECVSFEIVESPTPERSYPHTLDHGYVVPTTSLTYTQHDKTTSQSRTP